MPNNQPSDFTDATFSLEEDELLASSGTVPTPQINTTSANAEIDSFSHYLTRYERARREERDRTASISPSSPNTISYRWGVIDEASQITHDVFEEPVLAQGAPNKLPTKERDRLIKLAGPFIELYHNTQRNHRPNRPQEQRERSYFEANLRTNIIDDYWFLNNESVVPLSTIPWNNLKDAASDGLLQDIIVHDKIPSVIMCNACHRDNLPYSCLFMQYGRVWCSEHVPVREKYSPCFSCNRLADGKMIVTHDNHRIFACHSCLGRSCKHCGEEVEPPYVLDRFCSGCLTIETTDFWRPFSRALTWVGTTTGKIMKSPRTFSAEIEAMLDAGRHTAFLKEVPKEIGIATDGSIQSPGMLGFEVQTPRLAGARGEECVTRITGALNTGRAKVNASCGLHVHIDGAGLLPINRSEHPSALVDFWKANIVFEDVIKSFLPYSRRLNTYCRSISQAFSLMELDTIGDLQDAERIWYKEQSFAEINSAKGHHYHSSRYFGINLHPLFSQYHFEVRYHSGTIKAQKILEWANLHALIADAAVAGQFPRSVILDAQATPSLKDKTKLLFNLIGLAESSQHYFFTRQNKFSNKSADESNLE